MEARLPDAFCESVVSLLPTQEPSGRRGGRPAIPHAVVLKVIWFVLTVGCRWKDIPREFGCCGETARRRLRLWQELGVWQRVHLRLLSRLRQRGCLSGSVVLIDSTHVRAFGGGDRSGPSPVDRRKLGTKLTLLTDLRGTPLVLRSAPAHFSDHREILPTVAAYPAIGASRDDHASYQTSSSPTPDTTARPLGRRLSARGIDSAIRYRNRPHGSHLGRFRWPVERTFSWIKGLRRMRIRYDRHPL
ncbi:MAG: IS5 family transposase [Planctomycetaceae bacterium]